MKNHLSAASDHRSPPDAGAPRRVAACSWSAARPRRRAVANQADPEPGIELIAAAYNSLQDRFFRRSIRRDLLEAAWRAPPRPLPRATTAERRSTSQPDQRSGRRPRSVQDPVSRPARRRRAVRRREPRRDGGLGRDDQSVGEQHTYFLEPEQFSRYVSMLTTAEGRVGLGIVIQGTTAPFRIASVVPGAPGRASRRPGRRPHRGGRRSRRSPGSSSARSPSCCAVRGGPGDVAPARGDATVELTVVRARYKDAPLTMRVLPEGICHFKLTNFPVVSPSDRAGGTSAATSTTTWSSARRLAAAWIVDLRRTRRQRDRRGARRFMDAARSWSSAIGWAVGTSRRPTATCSGSSARWWC